MSRTVVVIAHGSRAEAANEAHRTVVAALDARTPSTVRPAFLELAEPDLGGAIDAAVAAGATEVAVLPLFLYPGRHLRTDVPALVAAARDRHPAVAITVLDAFGERPEVLDLLAAQVADAFPPA